MAMPPSSFSCTAGLHELANSTFPSLSRCWPAATLAVATARTINGAATWLRMFMVPSYSKLPGAAILAASSRRRLGRLFTTASLDDFGCLDEHRGRNGEPKRLGRPQIDHKVEREGILNRQVAWLSAFQDFVHVERGPAEVVPGSRSIRCEGASLGKSELEHARKSVPERAFGDRLLVVRQTPRGQLEHGAGPLTARRLKRGIEVRGRPHWQGLESHSERGRRHGGGTKLGVARIRIPQNRHS